MNRLTVAVVDDDARLAAYLTDGLSRALTPDGHTVLPYRTSVEALTERGTVALCDIQLDTRGAGPSARPARRTGAAAVGWLVARGWNVLLVSHHAQGRGVLEPMAAGARGFLCSSASMGQLIAATVAVGRGDIHMTPELADVLWAELRTDEGFGGLPFRVLRAFVEGQSAAMVTAGLGPSEPRLQEALRAILDRSADRVARYGLEPNLRRIAWMVACGPSSSSAEMARALGMKLNTFNTRLRELVLRYADCFPDEVWVAGDPVTGRERYELCATGEELKQQTAARLWAIKLGLCAAPCPPDPHRH